MSFTEFFKRSCPDDEIDISQAAFLPDLSSNSVIRIDTKKQLQLLTYKIVQLKLATISCSCNFKFRILRIIAIPGGEVPNLF